MPWFASRIETYCACSICLRSRGLRRPVRLSRFDNPRRSVKEFSDVALLGRARMPLGVGVMRAAEPLAAALAILLSDLVAGFVYARNSLAGLFLGLNGWSRHRFLRGQ